MAKCRHAAPHFHGCPGSGPSARPPRGRGANGCADEPRAGAGEPAGRHPRTRSSCCQRADPDRPPGHQGAGRALQHLVPRRLEERAARPVRLRAPLRAPDVPGQRELQRRLLQGDAADRRHEPERHDQHRPHQLLPDRAEGSARLHPVARVRPHGPLPRRAHAGAARRAAGRRPEREAAGPEPALRHRAGPDHPRDVSGGASLRPQRHRLDGRPAGRLARAGARVVPHLLRALERHPDAHRRHHARGSARQGRAVLRRVQPGHAGRAPEVLGRQAQRGAARGRLRSRVGAAALEDLEHPRVRPPRRDAARCVRRRAGRRPHRSPDQAARLRRADRHERQCVRGRQRDRRPVHGDGHRQARRRHGAHRAHRRRGDGAAHRRGPHARQSSRRCGPRNVAGMVRGLESISNKATILATAETYLGSPDAWKRSFELAADGDRARRVCGRPHVADRRLVQPDHPPVRLHIAGPGRRPEGHAAARAWRHHRRAASRRSSAPRCRTG